MRGGQYMNNPDINSFILASPSPTNLYRALFYSLIYAAQEGFFDDVSAFIEEHMDAPVPLEPLTMPFASGNSLQSLKVLL